MNFDSSPPHDACMIRRNPMKASSRFFAAAFLAGFALVGDLAAANLTPSQFRKFTGRYRGTVSGIAGNSNLGSTQVSFETAIRVTGRRVESLVPLISNLHAAPTHRIVWRKPTGTTRRAKLVGVYTGTFNNGLVSGPVSGTRTLFFTDRGATKVARYTVGFKDSLREVSYSGQNLSGGLRK